MLLLQSNIQNATLGIPVSGSMLGLLFALNLDVQLATQRVQAVSAGDYGGIWRDVGDVFDINSNDLSDSTVSFVPPGNPDYPLYGWMLSVPGATPLFSYALSSQGQSTVRASARRTVA